MAEPLAPLAQGAPRHPWWIRAALWPAAVIGHGLVRALWASCRVTREEGLAAWDDLLSRGPVIPCAWHHQLVLAAPWVIRHVAGHGGRPAFLVSQSRDGELAARALSLFGPVRIVRGSASRGGRAALRALGRAVGREGASPFLLPDGPRGPEREAKAGAVVLAQVTGAPLVPLGFAARSAWRLGSWDRMVVPRPFTRVAVVVGHPLKVPRELAADELGDFGSELAAALDEAERRAVAVLREGVASPS